MMTIDNSPRIQLLGPVGACHDDEPVDLGPPRQQRLLVPLIVSKGKPVPRESLPRWVWDTPGPDAVEQLGRLLSDVGTTLTAIGLGDALIHEKRLCRLNIPADLVDLHRFDRLVDAARRATGDRAAAGLYRQALDLVHGEPLGGLRGNRIDDYRTSLLERITGVRADYLDAELRAGNHDQTRDRKRRDELGTKVGNGLAELQRRIRDDEEPEPTTTVHLSGDRPMVAGTIINNWTAG